MAAKMFQICWQISWNVVLATISHCSGCWCWQGPTDCCNHQGVCQDWGQAHLVGLDVTRFALRRVQGSSRHSCKSRRGIPKGMHMPLCFPVFLFLLIAFFNIVDCCLWADVHIFSVWDLQWLVRLVWIAEASPVYRYCCRDVCATCQHRFLEKHSDKSQGQKASDWRGHFKVHCALLQSGSFLDVVACKLMNSCSTYTTRCDKAWWI